MDWLTQRNHFFQQIPLKYRIAYNTRFALEHFFGFPPFIKALRKWETQTQESIFQSVKHIEKKTIPIKEFDSSVDPNVIRKDYVRKGIPVVIRKGAESWKAFKEWDFSFFKEVYGDHPVLLTNHKDLGDHQEEQSSLSNLKEIIDGIDKDLLKYARFNPLLDTYPELQKDLNQDWLNTARDTKIKKHHVLFVGNKGTKTNIHNAGNDNIFVQIRGKKRWLIWDQNAYYVINPKVNRAPAKASPINPNNDVIPENPAFNYLPVIDMVLEPGDILLIPAYLWHYVENLTPTIGVGNRWISPHNSIHNNLLFAALELFNTSPSIFTTLNWRNGFDFNEIMMKNKKRNSY